jgi:hypothetical protein
MKAHVFNNNGVVQAVKIISGQECAFIVIELGDRTTWPSQKTLISNIYGNCRAIIVKPRPITAEDQAADNEFATTWFSNKEKHALLRKQFRYPEIILAPERQSEIGIIKGTPVWDRGYGQFNYYLLDLDFGETPLETQQIIWEEAPAPSIKELENLFESGNSC